jgi:fatty acid desaturase
VIARADLVPLLRPRPLLVLGKLALLCAAWVALALLAARLPLAAALPVWIAAGFVVNGVVQLGHDAWHKNLFARPWQNALAGHLFSLPFGVSFRAARHAHLAHHRWSRTERDPDAYNAGAGWRVTLQFWVVVSLGLVLAPIHFNLLYPAVFYERRALGGHVIEVGAIALAWAAVLALAPAHLVVDVWLLPVLFASPWNGLKSIADHHANVWKGDRFHTATTVRTTRLWTFLWHGLNFHLDHHLFPRVPGHALPRLHALLAPALAARGAPVFDGYLGTFAAALRAGPTPVDDNHFLERRA